jgi:hypothetical protein
VARYLPFVHLEARRVAPSSSVTPSGGFEQKGLIYITS